MPETKLTPAKQGERHCENCGKALFGRTDKRFCNDTCRNTFNREKTLREQIKEHENLPEIFRIIKNNYKILKSFGTIEPGSGIASLQKTLKEEGIDTRYFTSIYMEGKILWKFCFERGWHENENGYEIMDRPEQVEV
jgi:predicted nucleic acid-binding Zn ribbon protein